MSNTSEERRATIEADAARIAVVRALAGLGDFLCAVPALRALRARFPNAHVVLVGLERSRPLAERFSDHIDALWPFPGFPGIPERPVDHRELAAFLEACTDQPFDLAIQMHGSGVTSNAFTALIPADLCAGYYVPGHYRPNERYFLPFDDDEPEIARNLRLVGSLGAASKGDHLEFPLTGADQEDFERLQESGALSEEPYVVVHPGASEEQRRWSVEGFVEVARAIEDRGVRVAVTGSREEAGLCARVAGGTGIDLCGRTSLGALACLLTGARALVANDTGISHLAAALAVPSLVVFTGSDRARWAPLDSSRHRSVSGRETPIEKVVAQATALVADAGRGGATRKEAV